MPLACKALGPEKLDVWEYGNEPDLFSTGKQNLIRPPDWNETTYVYQWLNGTREVRARLEEACPELLEDDLYGYMGASIAGFNNTLKVPIVWDLGINRDGTIELFSTHK